MAELNRETPLFDKFLPIEVVERGSERVSLSHAIHSNSISGSEFTKQSTLVCRILNGTQPAPSLGHTERVLHIEITDEQDPYFLYFLDVGEHEFHHLKRDQSILVDFGVFPSKLIELIELCLRKPFLTDDTTSASSIVLGEISASINAATAATDMQLQMNSQVSDDGAAAAVINASTRVPTEHATVGSTYIAKLCTNCEDHSGVFSIIEANKFKQLTHISLRLKAGDDTAIKAYLASRLGFSLSVGKRQAMRIAQLDDRLRAEEERSEGMQQELQAISTRSSVDVQSLRSEYAQQLAEAQRAALECAESVRQRHEEQLQALRSQLEATQNESHERISNYEQQVADLNFNKNQVDFKLRDIERLLSNAEAERDRLMNEWEAVSSHRREVEEERTSLQRDVVRLESRVDVLTTQLQERDESMNKSLALQRASEEARASLEQRLQMYINNAEVLQENLRTGASEIEKGNDIITKLQTEVKSLREKIKMKSEVIRRQEVGVTDMRLKIADYEHELKSKLESEQTAQLKISNLQNQLDDANDRLQQNNKVIQGNKEVIAYLNEEINKWQLGMRVTTEPQLSNVLHSMHTVTPPAAVAQSKFPHAPQTTGSQPPITPENFAYDFHAQNDFGTASTAPMQRLSSPETKVSFVQPDKYASTSDSKYMEDVYKQGIQNLGLSGSEFTEKDFDWLQGVHSPNTSGGVLHDIGGGKASSQAVDLEQLDYYSTSAPRTSQRSSRLPTRSDNSTGHRVASVVSAATAAATTHHMDDYFQNYSTTTSKMTTERKYS